MFNAILDFLGAIGLGHPVSRAVSFACVGFGYQYFMKPKISYVTIAKDGKGNMASVAKEFYLTSSNANSAAKTWFPWYMWPAAAGLIGGIFI